MKRFLSIILIVCISSLITGQIVYGDNVFTRILNSDGANPSDSEGGQRGLFSAITSRLEGGGNSGGRLSFFNSCGRISRRCIWNCMEHLSPLRMFTDQKELCW